jgi:glutathione S-transferase
MLTLYQFPISHYCEKARWALDYKGLEYRIQNLLPGPHLKTTRRLAVYSTVPILVAGEETIQGSTEIITWLERRYPAKPLIPVNAHDASLAYEWERLADRNIGVPLRLFFYHHILQDRPLATTLLTGDCAWWARPLYALIFPALRKRMRAALQIDASNAAKATILLERTLDHLDSRVSAHRFLAGDLFSRADLTVSALLAPTWRGIEGMPPPVSEFIATHHARPSMVWARGIYDRYRGLN